MDIHEFRNEIDLHRRFLMLSLVVLLVVALAIGYFIGARRK
jgi:hypothetical protein